MAKKRQKTTRFSFQSYDAAHYRQTEQYTQAVEALFDRATAEITRAAAKGTYDPEKPFSFDDYPGVKSVMQDVTKQLASRMITVVETGSKKQWLFACDKNDGFIESIMDTSKVSKARLKKMQDRNLEALQTFQQRKVEGMNLSQRVWKYVGQYKDQLESALDVGLGEGRSADQLSRDVRGNLKEPNRLFRRVRDKRGNLVLSKAARAFHPGQGVYRSSYKNAMRLTRSEINMAYRESEYLRWQSLDFVVGFEIHRSNHEPLCECDLCERLVGRYPKTFKFKGWHPQCMCYATPILMDEETFDENELGDLKAALRGTQYKPLQAKNVVTDVPDEFKKWVKDHIEAQKNWGSTPYFIKDNFKDGKLSEGLKIDLPKPTAQVDVLAPYRAQIEQARQQATKWGLSVQLTMLDKYVADKDIASIQSRIASIQSKAVQMEQADADIRRKCYEWGLSTYILDEAMHNPDSKNILAKMAELEDRCINTERERKAFISDANDAIKEARKFGVDISDMLNRVATISGDKREWTMSKVACKKALQDLMDKILLAKGTPKMQPTQLDEVFARIDKEGVEYREVKPFAKQPTDTELIERIGGGDKTSGSCASLAFAFVANKGGLDVLDFRGGKSLDYFSKFSNLMHICNKVGGYSSFFTTGIQLMKQTQPGKLYYLVYARHAAIVRQVGKGKYEFLELQHPTSNGWKPLDSSVFSWRFGGSGEQVGLLIDIELLQRDSGFQKMVGYINTAQADQHKGMSGTTK